MDSDTLSPNDLRMKNWLALGGLVGMCLLPAATPSRAGQADQDDAGGIYYPMEPTGLLSLLPDPPANWKLTASKARERLSYALQPETYADRQYTFVPPPPPANVATPSAIPKTVFISLLDTGGDSERMRVFQNFKMSEQAASSGGAQYSNIMLDGCEAMQIEEQTETILTVKVSDRFLLTLRFNNLQETDRDQWMRLMQIPKLADVSAKASQTPLVSGPITLESIDELKPLTDSKLQSTFESVADCKKARMQGH